MAGGEVSGHGMARGLAAKEGDRRDGCQEEWSGWWGERLAAGELVSEVAGRGTDGRSVVGSSVLARTGCSEACKSFRLPGRMA